MALGLIARCGDLVAPGDLGIPPAPVRAEPDAPADRDATPNGVEPTSAVPIVGCLTTDRDELTEGESITFRAIASDPLGASNIVERALVDGDDGSVYGAFAASSPGTFEYSIRLTWGEISAIKPLGRHAAGPPGARRTFIARFANRQARAGRASIDIVFYCAPRDWGGACSGRCTNSFESSSCARHTAIAALRGALATQRAATGSGLCPFRIAPTVGAGFFEL